MCWNFGQDSYFRFVSGNNDVHLEIQFGQLPDFYKDFIDKISSRFIKSEIEEQNQIMIFSYRLKNNKHEEVNISRINKKNTHPDEFSYLVAERRFIENSNPQLMDQERLEEIIRNHDVLFYTGAGLSIASNIPGMNELEELLGLDEGEKGLYSLEKIINSPKETALKIRTFHKACLDSSPTKAHLALKELAVLKNIQIVTENLDCLHELSGIYPYRIQADSLRDEIGSDSLARFDYVICIGLSYDDRGFLGWYKKHHPHGKIIAIDLQKPSYLGDDDYLVRGDLQEIISSIEIHQALE